MHDSPPGRDEFLDMSSSSSSSSDVAEKTVLIPGTMLKEALSKQKEEESLERAREAVRRASRKHCSQSKTTVSIRRTGAVERLRVQEVTLTDPTCRGEKNGTHWILRSPR